MNFLSFKNVIIHASIRRRNSSATNQYDAILKKERELGVHPVKGLEFEVCFGEGDQMKVSVVYDSMEAFEEHGKKLGPIVEEMGFDVGQPEVFKVHNTIHKT